MGRILCSIVEDTAGWHDTITGHGTREASFRKYGAGSYQALRNEFHRNTRDNFLVELGKHGLGKKELVANVSFFVKIAADADGKLAWARGTFRGATVALRMEMNTLVILSNTPHPLDPGAVYAPRPVRLELSRAQPPGPDDECRTKRPENGRGFQLTESYFL
jgi:urea carboxylase-associated protein 2